MDEMVVVDHYRRERNRRSLEVGMEVEVVPSLEQVEPPRPIALSKSNSSPSISMKNVFNSEAKPIPAFKSFSLPRRHAVQSEHQINEVEIKNRVQSRLPSSIQEFLRIHESDLNFLIPKKLAYAAITPSKILSLKSHCQLIGVSVISSYLHRQYVPLCADFGPVTINIVHRFCQANVYMHCLNLFD